MTINQHYKKEFTDRIERLDITDYVQNFLLLYSKQRGAVLNNYLGDVEYLKDLLNNHKDVITRPLERISGFNYWSEQKVDYVSSNLGQNRGYIFYYICYQCDRRVKYLYRYKAYELPMCRICCHIKYVSPSRKERRISRLARILN